jgi:hypothetical protein
MATVARLCSCFVANSMDLIAVAFCAVASVPD